MQSGSGSEASGRQSDRFLWTLASLSDDDITVICDVTWKPGGLVSGKIPDKGNQISVLANNLKLTAFMFKMMEHCSGAYDIPVSRGAKAEENRQSQGAQSWQEKLGKDYGEHNSAPEAHERSNGGSTGLCAPEP